MPRRYFLRCMQTQESVEVALRDVEGTEPRIDAQVMGAFVTYHLNVAPRAEFGLVGDFRERGRPSPSPENDGALLWTEANHRALSARGG